MDKFAVCFRGKALGEMEVQAESLYTCFSARCRVPWDGLWCVWLVGEQDELRLGVPELCGSEAVICRRFSKRMTAPLGRILRAELRPVAAAGNTVWEPLPVGTLRSLWLRRQLREKAEGLSCRIGDCLQVAIPFDVDCPFPLPTLFCFARIRQIHGKEYAVFAFDGTEWPVFLE